MILTSSEIIAKELFKQTVYKEILSKKVEKLSTQIEDFLNNGFDFSDEFENIGAFKFEFDYYLDFEYIGYPHYLFEVDWKKMIKFDLTEENDFEIKSKLKESFMKIPELPSEIREDLYYQTIRECDSEFFCEAWKKTKEKLNSNKLCFVEVHDCGAGYDCDSGIRLSESEIEDKIEKWKRENSS
jgi:hypothetical protein